MHTYVMPNGKKVKIPKHPKRIVAADYIGDFLAAGVKPIGGSLIGGGGPFFKNKVTRFPLKK